MEYIKDESLTKKQEDLKWSLYCECEMEDAADIILVLKSFLKNLE